MTTKRPGVRRPVPPSSGTKNPARTASPDQPAPRNRRAEGRIVHSEALLRSVIENSPIATWISDEKGTLIKLNQACRELLRITDEEVVGKYNLLRDDIVEKQGFMPLVRAVFERGETVRFTLDYRTSDLSLLRLRRNAAVVLDVTISPVKNDRGKVTNAVVQNVDITERRRIESQREEALRALRETETLHQESQARYEAIFEATGTATLLVEADATIVMANRECRRVTGYGPEELVGTKWPAYVAPESLEIMLKYHRMRREEPGAAPRRYEVRMINKEGRRRDVVMDIAMIPGTGRSVVSMLDITGRKQAEDALRQTNRELEESRTAAIELSGALKAENEARKQVEQGLRDAETRYRLLFEHSPDGIVILDPATARPLEFNETACRQLGYTREEFARLSVSDLEAVETPEEISSRIADVLREGRNDFETRQLAKSGEIRDVLVTAQVIKILGHPVYHCVWRDITRRKKAEESLRDSEANMRYIVKHDPNAIAIYDRELHYIAVSDRFLQDYGVKEEDIIGKRHSEVFPEMLPRWEGVYQRCLAGAIERNDDDSFERPDGSIIYNRWECRPWHRVDGSIGGIITYTEVTTERKKAEKALRVSEEKYRALFDNAAEAIFVVQDDRLVFSNPMTTRLMGYSGEELAAKPFAEFVDPEDRRMAVERHSRRLKGEDAPGRYVIRLVDRTGRSRWAEINVILIDWEGRPATLNFANDITERKQAEEAVQASLREKEILLREIHHRVKNNMQVISSLLNLQAEYIADADARRMLRDSQLRIRSMALIHEKLYQGRDLSKIEFASYVRSLAVHLFQFYKVDQAQVRLEFDLEDVLLDINSAIPCGLVLSELVANALKHAFPEGRKGTVWIRLKREKGVGLKLQVADNGIGLPDALDVHHTGSFGLQIVSLLVGQLEGTLEIERTNGAVFTIAFRELEYRPRT